MKKTTFLLLLLCAALACSQRSENYMEKASGAMASADAATESSYQSMAESYDSDDGMQEKKPAEQRIIKTANYRFEVKDVEASSARIGAMVKEHSGTIAQSNQTSSSRFLNQNITIRVPSEKFETLLIALEKESIYTNAKRISSTDVSEEYYDLEIRLKTKKDVRDRYIEILRNKAKTVQEIILAEEKIRVLQEEIEAKEGRLNFLKNQVSHSTIHLDIYQKIPYVPQRDIYKVPFVQKLKMAFSGGWELLVNFALGLVYLWPLLLLFVLVFWKWSWFRDKFRR